MLTTLEESAGTKCDDPHQIGSWPRNSVPTTKCSPPSNNQISPRTAELPRLKSTTRRSSDETSLGPPSHILVRGQCRRTSCLIQGSHDSSACMSRKGSRVETAS